MHAIDIDERFFFIKLAAIVRFPLYVKAIGVVMYNYSNYFDVAVVSHTI